MAAPGSQALRGRTREVETLRRLLEDVRGGRSAVLVIRGEAGIGKTALLHHCSREATGFRLAQIAGVESEMEIAFAALHQLCAPMLTALDALPSPQQAALRVAFGLSSGAVPDRFLIALATLGLLAEIAAERPVACLVDDAQWLDSASAQVLGFVARRLVAESVLIVFAVRQPTGDRQLAGLPELRIGGLEEPDAQALLTSAVPGRLDAQVRDRIVSESRGNPLALLELPRGMTAAELAGGFTLPVGSDVPGYIEEHYLRRLDSLPKETQRLVLLAAAEPSGDPVLLWRAAGVLRIDRSAAAPAESEGFLDIGAGVRFGHPLVRSAVYGKASVEDRRLVHGALAAATDPVTDPDRRAWHLASAAWGPDEEVAAELERSASRAQARGGLAAAAALLRRSVSLSSDPVRRADRALEAVYASLHAGDFSAAPALLTMADADAADDLQRARVGVLRAQVAFVSTGGPAAAPLLLEAARRAESLDADLARDTYIDAWVAAGLAGSMASTATLLEVSKAALAAPPLAHEPRCQDLILEGLSRLVVDGFAAAAPTLRRAGAAVVADELTPEQSIFVGLLGGAVGSSLWDDDLLYRTATRQVRFARMLGALDRLPSELATLGIVHAWSGDVAGASAAIAEADAVASAIGAQSSSPYAAMALASVEGREAEALALIGSLAGEAAVRGEGTAVQFAQSAAAVLYNGIGQYEQAMTAALRASDGLGPPYVSAWVLPELIEASVRCGQHPGAVVALDRLAESTSAAGTDWGLGIEARCRALVSRGEVAEAAFRRAIDLLARTRVRTALARAHLLYGEWLRREKRRGDARTQLRTAHEQLDAIGMHAYAGRARRELVATGEHVRKRRDETRNDLTPQEQQIALLARDGRTNVQIGTELYLSARTVEWHLRKVFTKLGIATRGELADALRGTGPRA